jgi:TonB family protein
MTFQTQAYRTHKAWCESWQGAVLTLLILLASSPSSGQDLAAHEVAVSPDIAVPHGTWHYRQLEEVEPPLQDSSASLSSGPRHLCTGTLLPCPVATRKGLKTHLLQVANASQDTLECTARMSYDGLDVEHIASKEVRRVIEPGETQVVLNDAAAADVPLHSAEVECTARAPLPPLSIPPQCGFQFLEAPPLDQFYPAASQRLGEEGPVTLSFALDQAQGHATDIQVIGSSLSERLDAGAVKYLGSVTFNTPCSGTHYRIKLKFQLR